MNAERTLAERHVDDPNDRLSYLSYIRIGLRSLRETIAYLSRECSVRSSFVSSENRLVFW